MADLIQPFGSRHTDYLHDESRTRGSAQSISFPACISDVQKIVTCLYQKQVPVTVQASRTGIVGGAVPVTGHVLNVSAMNKVTGMHTDDKGRYCLQAQPGLTLAELNQQVAARRFDTAGWDARSLAVLDRFQKDTPWFWPPDPTEDTASVGGMAATNARGICARYYGATGRYIQAVKVVDPWGQICDITRGRYRACQDRLPLSWQQPAGGNLLSSEDSPPDLVDLFIGSEGRLGVICELTLVLLPLPPQMWGITFFFNSLDQAAGFIEAIRMSKPSSDSAWIAAMEIMDRRTMDAIQTLKQSDSRLKALPEVDPQFRGAVYLEIHGTKEDEVEDAARSLMDRAESFGCAPDNTWAFCSSVDLPRIRLFRKAAPKAVNHLVDMARHSDAQITKLGTDMVIPHISLTDLIHMYKNDMAAAGLKGAIFGHAGDNHLHVNLLPEDAASFAAGKQLIRHWADQAHKKGGTVAGEHGIGLRKKDLFGRGPLPAYLKWQMRLKQILDPEKLWNPGKLPEKNEKPENRFMENK
jgi:D-lactate dehydrogenase (cytochrome)